jgi:uncharacterized protein YjbJ (UPF0337 family)
MNTDIVKGKWAEIRGALRQKWGKLTDSDYDQIAGNQDRLIGLLQQRYGYEREQAEREVQEVLNKYSTH